MPGPEFTKVRIFVASPSDVLPERGQLEEVVGELNRSAAARMRLVLELVRWETHSMPGMGRPQDLINQQVGNYDIFIGLMWHRFGIPTGVAGSGTEEEFRRALSSWKRTGSPKILFYFSEAPVPPARTVALAEQLLQVSRFREEVERLGLYWIYDNPSRFRDVVRPHLEHLLDREFAPATAPLGKDLRAVLDLEKDLCRQRNVPFFTPRVMLGLLAIPGGIAGRGLEALRAGFRDETIALLRSLDDSARASSPGQPFTDFRWEDRPDVQAARRWAHRLGSDSVDARHLLLGFLATAGRTQARLKLHLGEENYRELEQLARDLPDATILGTPFQSVQHDPSEADDPSS